MGVLMPIYTVAIIVFFVYTTMKVGKTHGLVNYSIYYIDT